jgi:SHS2 domain-containing protein
MVTASSDRPGWERFEVPGGVGLLARGASLRDVFARAALGMFALMAGPPAEEREVREVRAHADSLEGLLVNWLGECLYVHDVEGFAAGRVEFAALDAEPRAGGEPFRLHGFLHGEERDPAPQAGRIVVRSVSSRASLDAVAGDLEARVVLEIQ